MNKKQLKKRLQAIQEKYISLNEMGVALLNDNKLVDSFAGCLGHKDLEKYLFETAINTDGEVDNFKTPEGIIEEFEYHLEIFSENELIQLKADKEAEESALMAREKVSKIIIKQQAASASIGISQMYSGMNFADDNGGNLAKGLDTLILAETIIEQEELLAKGDLTSLENMLHSQAHTLNAIFTNMVSKMAVAKHVDNMEVYGRIALKAQNQTRQTVSTLAELKGLKKTTFIHQINQAKNQQVNNGAGENLSNSANEKGFNHVDRTSEAGRTGENTKDKALVTPERGENTGGQKTLSHERPQTWDAILKDEGTGETVGSDKKTGTRSTKTG